MTRLGIWVQGARPRTLGAGVTPVLVGTAAAGVFVPWRFVAALLVALALQVGANLANDFHDGVRGVDTPDRLGPPRLTSSGLAPARTVLLAALLSILVAGVAGLALAAATTWWLVPIGALAMLALWLYSGGPRPYAELGLGEVMVFVFFGLMATAGSAFVQAETVPAAAWWAAVPVGLLAVAILVANNLRDIPTDAVAGKRTLAVRLGERRTRRFYRLCVSGPSPGSWPGWSSTRSTGERPAGVVAARVRGVGGRDRADADDRSRERAGADRGPRRDGPAADRVRGPARPRAVDRGAGP